MKKNLTLVAALLVASFTGLKAQQDPMVTKYMFNSLGFNPAYAGSNDHLSLGLLHRSQWTGIDGAPQTQSFTIHSPLANEAVGLGLSIVHELVEKFRGQIEVASEPGKTVFSVTFPAVK